MTPLIPASQRGRCHGGSGGMEWGFEARPEVGRVGSSGLARDTSPELDLSVRAQEVPRAPAELSDCVLSSYSADNSRGLVKHPPQLISYFSWVPPPIAPLLDVAACQRSRECPQKAHDRNLKEAA